VLIVANTAENLDCLEAMFGDTCVVPVQVEIIAQFVKFDLSNLVHMAVADRDAKSLQALWTNGFGQLLAAPRVITRSGTEASVCGATEVTYPTDFDAQHGGTNTSNVATAVCEAIQTTFQTRKTGAILQVLPEISPDGRTVNLTITPSFVEPPVWQNLGGNDSATRDHAPHIPFRPPYFHTYTYATRITVEDGATVLAGGGVPTRDARGLVYCFVTVTLVGTDGERLRKRGSRSRSDHDD
jgi:hypothetical protein